MYLPSAFALHDLEQVAPFVDAAGAAELITFDGTRPVATLLPVLWDRPVAATATAPGSAPVVGGAEPEPSDRPADGTGSGLGRLLGHLARANPQWSTVRSGTEALAVVTGPQAYVSPGWYPGKAEHGRVVPTWNYVSVHLSGPLTVHEDPAWLLDVVTRLTARHERHRAEPWSPEQAPPGFVDGMLRAIVGVELTVTRVEAKHKLSQNRSPADRAGVVDGLAGEPGPGPAAVRALMLGG